MVEGTGLENRHTGEPGIESSNLSLSVPIRSVHVEFVATGPRLVQSCEYRFFVYGDVWPRTGRPIALSISEAVYGSLFVRTSTPFGVTRIMSSI